MAYPSDLTFFMKRSMPLRLDTLKGNLRYGAIAGATIIFLYTVHLYSFLLFHVLVEIFSVVVAFAILMFAWNTRDKIANSSLILVDTLPTGLCEIDPAFRVHYINPAGQALIGYDAEDIRRGVHLGMLLDAKERRKAQRRLAMLRQDRSIDSAEYRLRRKDGTSAEILGNSTPIVRNGELKAIQTSLTDVTELHRLQRRLHEARKMEAVALLAGGMAHEINNVLMSVIGGIDLIRMCAADHTLEESDFDDVHKGCERIAALVKKLLAYSEGGRYRSEAIDFQPRTVDVGQARLRPGMRPGHYIRLQVRDDGRGMDSETRSHIFEPFFSTHFPGRGMGMAAVYGIVKNHGGWIGVDSRKGQGTTVRVYLPVNQEFLPSEAKHHAAG